MSDVKAGVRSRTRTSLVRFAISSAWFLAILATVALAGAEPLLGFPVALGLISLSVLLSGENPSGLEDRDHREE